jgi:2-polyprenyl-3-methyl-5-hydroxy-6-metoxy-1,4-benzoquinol methylase
MNNSFFFERVDPNDISWFLYSGDHLQRYKYFASFYKDKIVLDAACGSGFGCEIILKHSAKKVIGIDINEQIIDNNIKKYNNPNLSFKKLNCQNLSQLNETFDLVVSFETIEHLESPDIFVKEVYNILNKNGIFICSTPNLLRFKGSNLSKLNNEYHLHEFTFEELHYLLSKYFKIIDTYAQTESLQFLRYLELKNDLFQFQQVVKSSIAMRIELFIRKILNKPFQPIPFYYPFCERQTEEDFVIEKIDKPEKWHKTFIFLVQKI